ncbi:MAG: flagellar hook-length control protein FliK [Fibrobacteria bacterium]|nr:flagellar hook-length control protein FliK [Fibrobacteria bacterium]
MDVLSAARAAAAGGESPRLEGKIESFDARRGFAVVRLPNGESVEAKGRHLATGDRVLLTRASDGSWQAKASTRLSASDQAGVAALSAKLSAWFDPALAKDLARAAATGDASTLAEVFRKWRGAGTEAGSPPTIGSRRGGSTTPMFSLGNPGGAARGSSPLEILAEPSPHRYQVSFAGRTLELVGESGLSPGAMGLWRESTLDSVLSLFLPTEWESSPSSPELPQRIPADESGARRLLDRLGVPTPPSGDASLRSLVRTLMRAAVLVWEAPSSSAGDGMRPNATEHPAPLPSASPGGASPGSSSGGTSSPPSAVAARQGEILPVPDGELAPNPGARPSTGPQQTSLSGMVPVRTRAEALELVLRGFLAPAPAPEGEALPSDFVRPAESPVTQRQAGLPAATSPAVSPHPGAFPSPPVNLQGPHAGSLPLPSNVDTGSREVASIPVHTNPALDPGGSGGMVRELPAPTALRVLVAWSVSSGEPSDEALRVALGGATGLPDSLENLAKLLDAEPEGFPALTRFLAPFGSDRPLLVRDLGLERGPDPGADRLSQARNFAEALVQDLVHARAEGRTQSVDVLRDAMRALAGEGMVNARDPQGQPMVSPWTMPPHQGRPDSGRVVVHDRRQGSKSAEEKTVVDISMDPSGLGPVEAHMELRGDDLDIRFSALESTTVETIEQHLPELRSLLVGLGFQPRELASVPGRGARPPIVPPKGSAGKGSLDLRA